MVLGLEKKIQIGLVDIVREQQNVLIHPGQDVIVRVRKVLVIVAVVREVPATTVVIMIAMTVIKVEQFSSKVPKAV